jgi:hypothetical protein
MNTYNPAGPNVYVVSLSMLSGAGEGARNMLILYTMGKVIAGGYDQFFFESRLPGLLSWVRRRCRDEGRDVESLTEEEQLDLAESYFRSTRAVKGKQFPLDPLLRIYAQIRVHVSSRVPGRLRGRQVNEFRDGRRMAQPGTSNPAQELCGPEGRGWSILHPVPIPSLDEQGFLMSLRTLSPDQDARLLPRRSGSLALLMRNKRSIVVTLLIFNS